MCNAKQIALAAEKDQSDVRREKCVIAIPGHLLRKRRVPVDQRTSIQNESGDLHDRCRIALTA
jgi:hypothetical protein